MISKNHDLSDTGDLPSGEGLQIGIVVSEWNAQITGKLKAGCVTTLELAGVHESDITTIQVPGSYELPAGARILAGQKKYDAIICLGCVIRGETDHDKYISQSVASGLMQLGLMINVPIIFGVLTPNSMEQALERAGGKHGNKGVEAASTALKMAALRKSIGSEKSRIGFGI